MNMLALLLVVIGILDLITQLILEIVGCKRGCLLQFISLGIACFITLLVFFAIML